jgi:uncharacterized membrane protein
MDFHYILKFLHVAGAILWLGGGTLLILGGTLAARSHDDPGLRAIVRLGTLAGPRVFSPSGVVVLLTGLTMLWTGGLPFAAWVILSLAGIAASILTGALMLGPLSERARDAADPAQAAALTRRFLRCGAGDLLILFAIVWLMVLRPYWGDVPALAIPVVAALAGGLVILTAPRAA